ncbi:MAG TPA: RNA polymerase sigma factor [Burkholderiales bacterium]|nr:RNA polymerase sigma factor [Burkholderiales bacterium]
MLPARLAHVTVEPVPDEQLMLRYRDGDAAAFEQLYGRHRGGVFRYVLRQVGLRSAAEEVFQEIWVNIVSSRARYRVEARFATFLYHVAHNCVVDYFRRKTPLHLISLDDDGDEVNQVAGPARDQPERAVAIRQSAAKLLNALALLPPEQREVFLLHEEGGLSLEEIATVTGTGRETAKSRLRYALAKLREGIEHEADVA